jgi:demethylmenaquinone methyltransferase/2-methoxy-6-polyprenyl-1,4-benzoquinol methylase
VRQLADGREFTIVKRYWEPEELRERLLPLGFQLDLHVTANGNFLYGSGT